MSADLRAKLYHCLRFRVSDTHTSHGFILLTAGPTRDSQVPHQGEEGCALSFRVRPWIGRHPPREHAHLHLQNVVARDGVHVRAQRDNLLRLLGPYARHVNHLGLRHRLRAHPPPPPRTRHSLCCKLVRYTAVTMRHGKKTLLLHHVTIRAKNTPSMILDKLKRDAARAYVSVQEQLAFPAEAHMQSQISQIHLGFWVDDCSSGRC